MKNCKGLFDHSLENLKTLEITKHTITKRCQTCGYSEVLRRSKKNVYFVNNLVFQKKKWAADDNRKELLQPGNIDGSPNEEFTNAYGFNPFDERTKTATPRVQGGLAE